LDATDRDANISNFDDAGTRSSDGQQGLNYASSQSSSSHVAAPNDLLEEDEYERFISDCNSPHTMPLFPAPTMPHLGPMVQQAASLQLYVPASKEVTPTEQTGLESGKAFLHSGGMWRIQWQIRAPIHHRIRLCCMTYGLKPGFLAFFVYTSFYLPLLSA
jgi:hypothetical protein